MFKKKFKECSEQAKGCKGRFVPATPWQETCGNHECKIQRKRRVTNEWHRENREHRREYMLNYRAL